MMAKWYQYFTSLFSHTSLPAEKRRAASSKMRACRPPRYCPPVRPRRILRAHLIASSVSPPGVPLCGSSIMSCCWNSDIPQLGVHRVIVITGRHEAAIIATTATSPPFIIAHTRSCGSRSPGGPSWLGPVLTGRESDDRAHMMVMKRNGKISPARSAAAREEW